MTLEDLLDAIAAFDNGYININNGEFCAFLLKKKWYPLRAIINHAKFLANENDNLTTYEAIKELVFLGCWTRVQDVVFHDQQAVYATNEEIKNEIKLLSEAIYDLVH